MGLDLNRTKPDHNWRSESNKSFVAIVSETISAIDPTQYDDILKFSHTTEAYVNDCEIGCSIPSREDGVDINKCKDITFLDTRIFGGDKYGMTIKGGSERIVLRGVIFKNNSGSGIDIDIGNFSDTNMDKTTGVILDDVSTTSGRAVRVRVGRGNRPVIIGGKVKILFWHSLALKAYVWFKYYYLKILNK